MVVHAMSSSDIKAFCSASCTSLKWKNVVHKLHEYSYSYSYMCELHMYLASYKGLQMQYVSGVPVYW